MDKSTVTSTGTSGNTSLTPTKRKRGSEDGDIAAGTEERKPDEIDLTEEKEEAEDEVDWF